MSIFVKYLTAGYQVTMCGRLQFQSLIFLLVILYTDLFLLWIRNQQAHQGAVVEAVI